MHDDGETLTQLPGADGASDSELLREYAATGAQSAFNRLVERHVAFVYSAALRQTGHHEMAQDATQAVFVILARKAATLRRETILSGWLFRAVRYAALDARKMEARRHVREQEAARMQQVDTPHESEPEWEQLAPLLDEAIANLGEKDRHAVLLRFFERKNFGEIGAALGANENSARVRVVRAIEKLRGYLRRRGVAVSATALGGVLLGNAVQAAPATLAASLGKCATAARLVEASLQRLMWRRLIRVAVVILFLLLLLGGTTFEFRQRQAAKAAEQAEAARGVRDLMIAIDRTFLTDDRDGFVALIHLGDTPKDPTGTVLSDYIRAESLFRREMQRAFNVRQRAFDATFRELCAWPLPGPDSYLRLDSAATNIMSAKYPVRFIRTAAGWKWDMFSGLSAESRTQHVAILSHKTAVLDRLATQIHERATTNVVEILESIRSATP